MVFSILETLLRMFPTPTKTGLHKIGNPDASSPVLLTCNYHLTVLRVKKALKGLDCYLLVADSKGVNVWCSAAGGMFNNHSVISVIKTSKLNQYVEHRKIILPKLAACGIEAKVIKEKTGWEVLWGPVYAKDLPEFIANNFQPKSYMQHVKFNLTQRIEMAVALAFPISVIFGIVYAIFWTKELWQIILLVWIVSAAELILFPYLFMSGNNLTPPTQLRKLLVAGVFLILSVLPFVMLYVYTNKSTGYLVRWLISAFLVVATVFMDINGMTPIFKGDFLEDKKYRVDLDQDKCIQCLICKTVCPKGCFEYDEVENKMEIRYPVKCIKCGACIVQCPTDALIFITEKGEKIPPTDVRTYKISMMGKRVK